MIGRTISQYKILEKLGEGGMGVVYKAEDTRLKRTVALKFLRPEVTFSAEVKERFVLEAQAASALDHPNICTMYTMDEVDGQTFISMAYLEGQSLQEKIESGPLKLDEIVHIAIEVAEGLREAHAKGIVHRDIKSANIMVSDTGRVKIMDFGLAKLTGRSRLTKREAIVGTVDYMSPEQARGEPVDHRTDIWSLGVVLYEMLTGETPFVADSDVALLHKVIYDEPDDVSSLNPDVAPGLSGVVAWALAKNKDDRYTSISEFLEDLRNFQRAMLAEQAVPVEEHDSTVPIIEDPVPVEKHEVTVPRIGEPVPVEGHDSTVPVVEGRAPVGEHDHTVPLNKELGPVEGMDPVEEDDKTIPLRVEIPAPSNRISPITMAIIAVALACLCAAVILWFL